MGRPKKQPKYRQTYVTVGFYHAELMVIERTMTHLGINRSAAVRLLLRAGGRSTTIAPRTTAPQGESQ